MTTTSLPPSSDPIADLLSVTVTGTPAAVRIEVRGEVDSSTAPALRDAVDRALADRVGTLTVDLDGVTFLDSAGLCVLAGAHRRATEAGLRLRVLASERAVVRPLQITGLYEVLAVEPADTGAHSAA